MSISVEIDQDPCGDVVRYSFSLTRKQLVDAQPPGDMRCEFNAEGGISSDLV